MAANGSPFPKGRRLLRRNHFLRAARKGKHRTGHLLSIEIFRRSDSRPTRLGITASRRYGKSHERNRFKRLVREAFRTAQDQLPPSLDLVVKPKPEAKLAHLTEIQKELLSLMI